MPTIERPQHMEALERANEIRLAQSELKRELAAGRISLEAALSDPRSQGSFPVHRLLRAIHGFGPHAIRRVLLQPGIPESRRVDALTERQRIHLVAAARQHRVRGHSDTALSNLALFGSPERG